MTLADFSDPRLVAIYETVNAYDPETQPRFYANLARETGARTVLDVGCGTGLITRALAAGGYDVAGADPSAAMVAVARTRPYGDRVRWVVGGVADAGVEGVDLAFMSGHVAQFFLADDEWDAALRALARAVRPGGTLAFESRNPAAREWETWHRRSRAHDPVHGWVEHWAEVHEVGDGVVRYANRYRFEATGEEVAAACALRFRTREELAASLRRAGFETAAVYGGWDRRPAGTDEPEFVVVATRGP